MSNRIVCGEYTVEEDSCTFRLPVEVTRNQPGLLQPLGEHEAALPVGALDRGFSFGGESVDLRCVRAEVRDEPSLQLRVRFEPPVRHDVVDATGERLLQVAADKQRTVTLRRVFSSALRLSYR